MKVTLLAAATLASLVMLSGCSSAGTSSSQSVSVVGKIQETPIVDVSAYKAGFACAAGSPTGLTLNGQQIKLKDAAGKIVGIADLKGWTGDPKVALKPAGYGYVDGKLCSWDFTFKDVPTDSKFYTLEFADTRIAPETITNAELLKGPVIQVSK